MTSTSTSTISPRQTSLLNLNNWIDELELAMAEDATPTVLTLTEQIMRAVREHHELFYAAGTTDEGFNAMARRFQAAGAAFKARRQVTAGVDEADQATAGAAAALTPLPNSSSLSAGGAIPSTVDAGGRAGPITAGVIAEIQSNQAALAASLADLQRTQAELQSSQVSVASALASLQQEQRGLASSVADVLSAVQDVQRDNRTLRDELSAMRSQVEHLPERQDAFAMDMLHQQQLLRRELDQVKRQRDAPAPVIVTADLLDFTLPLIDYSVIRPPCQKTLDLFGAFPDPAVHIPPPVVPVLAQVPDSPPSGPVSSETPEPSSPPPPTPSRPSSPSAASPTSVAQPTTFPSPALAAVICDGSWGSDSSGDEARDGRGRRLPPLARERRVSQGRARHVARRPRGDKRGRERFRGPAWQGPRQRLAPEPSVAEDDFVPRPPRRHQAPGRRARPPGAQGT